MATPRSNTGKSAAAKPEYDSRARLEERLGGDVLARLQSMAHEFVRFERGQLYVRDWPNPPARAVEPCASCPQTC